MNMDICITHNVRQSQIHDPRLNLTHTAPLMKNSNLRFGFEALSSTTVQFEFEVSTPTTADDSFYVSVDGGTQATWQTGTASGWTWRTYGTQYPVTAGSHILTVHGREDGAKLRQVRIIMVRVCVCVFARARASARGCVCLLGRADVCMTIRRG